MAVWRPDLVDLSFDQLYDGLSDEHKRGIDRIMWTFRNKLINMEGVEQGPVLDFELTADDLRLLYDPLLPSELEKALTPEEQTMALCAIDPVIWVREILHYDPRVYQIMALRSKDRTRAYRWGRRSGKSTCMLWEVLWFSWMNSKIVVIIVCPIERHVQHMWEMIDLMVLNTGITPLKEAIRQFGITRKTRKPWEIEFINGSKIKAFTSGARSGGKADSVRGHEGHMILMDEMDLMQPGDLDAITAMMQKTSDEFKGKKRLIVSSTPNGRRDMFYIFCNKKTVKELWYPSFVNPHFTPEDEEEQRDFLTESGFVHEIVGDWGQESTGVFKPALLKHVANPDEPYSYWNTRPEKYTGPIILGVDWDKYGAGVNLVGTANVDGVLRVILREEIERAKFEFTLGAGVNRVKQLDQTFNFAYIYCDRGYGERQWEELVEQLPWGADRVIGKNYSSSVEETDPVTRERVKEEFKPFLVDNAVTLYEQRKVTINPDDSDFIAQMLAYVQLRISPTGRPVFGSRDPDRIGDHALEAWMLSLLGHTERFGDLVVRFKQVTPKVVSSNDALAPGDTKEERSRRASQLMKVRRPMTSLSRKVSASIFDRPGF